MVPSGYSGGEAHLSIVNVVPGFKKNRAKDKDLGIFWVLA